MKAKKRRDSADGQSQDVLGPLQDLVRQLRSGARTKKQLVDFNEGRCFCKKKAEAPVPLKYDKTKYGWTLLEKVPFDGQPFGFKLVEFLKPEESSVNGEVMKLRAKELNAHLGQGEAEYLLENQDEIPAEYRGEYYLVFPGTVWQDSGGRRIVPCLDWLGGRWFLDFGWLRDDWGSRACLVGLRKPAFR